MSSLGRAGYNLNPQNEGMPALVNPYVISPSVTNELTKQTLERRAKRRRVSNKASKANIRSKAQVLYSL